jgi:hypothetical protein
MEECVNDQQRWYDGVDWASESHYVWLADKDGRRLGERSFKHAGDGLAEMVGWLLKISGAAEPDQIDLAIEVPHGPVVETLIERGFNVWALNPKQMDRFRDRYSVAGAKDDSRDAQVMASALRTDPHCFRRLTISDPIIVELREWSRIAADLTAERTALVNRLRQQLWRYFPAFLELEADLSAPWTIELWQAVPTPEAARRVRKTSIETILKRHRIRRLSADQVLEILRQRPLTVAPGTIQACTRARLRRARVWVGLLSGSAFGLGRRSLAPPTAAASAAAPSSPPHARSLRFHEEVASGQAILCEEAPHSLAVRASVARGRLGAEAVDLMPEGSIASRREALCVGATSTPPGFHSHSVWIDVDPVQVGFRPAGGAAFSLTGSKAPERSAQSPELGGGLGAVLTSRN